MASRTREKLIEAAKLLFIRKGVENTTISDIANASDKGRRTIYTYFKNKKEIYNAVVERESDKIVGELRGIANMQCPASEKLRQFAFQRMVLSRNSASPYSTIKSLLTMNISHSDRVKRMAWEKETEIVSQILTQGVDAGEFEPESVQKLRECLFHLLRSIDLVAADTEISHTDAFGPSLVELCIRAIKIKN